MRMKKDAKSCSSWMNTVVALAAVVTGIATMGGGCGGTVPLGGAGFGAPLGGTCAALATEAGQLAIQAFDDPANADFCKVAQLNLDAFDAGCFGGAIQFALPAGISAADFRAQLEASAAASCP